MRKIIFILPFLIFASWFTNKEIIGGDWPYLFREVLINFPSFPPSWSVPHGNGMGGPIPSYFLDQYFYFTVFISLHIFHISWEIGYKIFWFGGFLLISMFSIFYLCKIVFYKISDFQIIFSTLLYITNTYILMVVGGGQMGIALAYSIAPLVLAQFIKIINDSTSLTSKIKNQKSKIKDSILVGLVLAVQVMFDPRITFLTLIGVFIYFIFSVKAFFSKNSIIDFIYSVFLLVVPFGVMIILHFSWILPFLIFKYNPMSDLGAATPTVDGLKFLSFASFSQAYSFLHPNWPENVFGKVSFMKSEFIFLPIFAYSSLLFLYSKLTHSASSGQNSGQQNNLTMEEFNNKIIIFLTILGLVGVFLAKGTSEPFGEINILLFRYIPGFGIFRDPTKFYLLIALSYSVLIPFTIEKIGIWLGSKKQFSIKSKIFNFKNIFLLVTIFYLLFLIRPVILGQLTGTFKHQEVPKDYVVLKNFLSNQPDFFRTLWIPQQQRFTFATYVHPAVEINSLYKASGSAEFARILNSADSRNYISNLGIKYVIIPYDSMGEIFLKDRKYDSNKYKETIKELKKIPLFKEVPGFGNIIVFKTEKYQNHFFITGEGSVSYKMVNQTKYIVNVSLSKPTSLVFSENFNPFWAARFNNNKINSVKTKNGLNSFYLKKIGKYSIEVYFIKDEVYNFGRVISSIFLFIIFIIIFPWRYLYKKIKKNYFIS